MTAFLKKEWVEMIRTGRAFLMFLIFVLFGIMNPAIAKLTPWMMEIMAESLEESGFVLTAVSVDAMTSWAQFYKNIPMALLIFVLLESGIFTGEYQKGTLIQIVTKGVSRRKILASKSIMAAGTWSIGFFLSYGITWLYNMYLWDNGIASSPLFAAICWWLFGMCITAFLIFFSTISETNVQVLLGTGTAAGVLYLLGLFPKLAGWLPGKLMEGMSILQKTAVPADYRAAFITAGAGILVCVLASVLCFDRKKL